MRNVVYQLFELLLICSIIKGVSLFWETPCFEVAIVIFPFFLIRFYLTKKFEVSDLLRSFRAKL
jgi:TRAP-type C4-dicarboxylate transport system permease large subunit